MASFRIHEDQENSSLGMRKENADLIAAAQRRALGELNQLTCHLNRTNKLPELTNVALKSQEENRMVRQVKNEKNIVLPVAQFRAFSVYEDKPSEVEIKKREALKLFLSKEVKKDNNTFFSNAANNVRAFCNQIDKPSAQPKGDHQIRVPISFHNEEVESPMSVADTSILSMSISKNESQLDNTVDDDDDDDDEESVTAQTDREMFFHVLEYRQDIYEYMREIEVKHRANPRYMRKQPDVTHVMRSVLVDWLVEVCDEYGQQSETLHLAVSYVDRFLSYMSVVRTKLQLVGTAAAYIASKFEEVYPPEVSEFVYITDDTYTKREVLRMEHLILKVLSFDLSTPTSLAFLSLYCISNALSKKIFHLAAYIAELSLLEADPYLQFKPSIIAAASLATARHCLLCKESLCDSGNEPGEACLLAAWPSSLEKSTGYTFSELEPCARELARTHSHVSVQPYRAIPDKYKSNKYDTVSCCEPRPMFSVPEYQPPAPVPRATETARSS